MLTGIAAGAFRNNAGNTNSNAKNAVVGLEYNDSYDENSEVEEVGEIGAENNEGQQSDVRSDRPLKNGAAKNFFHAIVKKKKKNLGQKRIALLKSQSRYNAAIQAALTIIGLASSVMYYEFNENKYGENTINILLWVNLITTICHLVTIVFDFLFEASTMAEDSSFDKMVYRGDCNRIGNLVFMLLFYLIHPNPWLVGIKVPITSEVFKPKNIYIEINYIFVIICQTRIYFLLKFYLNTSVYSASRFRRLCRVNYFNQNNYFVLKSILRQKPMSTLLITTLMVMYMHTFLFRILEKVWEEDAQKEFGYLSILWFLVITGVTIGYGDRYPFSDVGRLFSMLFLIIALILISNLLNSLDGFLNIASCDDNFKLIYNMINNTEQIEENKVGALKIVTSFAKLAYKLRRKKLSKENGLTLHKRDDLLLGLHEAKEQRKLSLMDQDKVMISVSEKMDYLEKTVDELVGIANDMNLQANRIFAHIEGMKNPISNDPRDIVIGGDGFKIEDEDGNVDDKNTDKNNAQLI